MAHVLDQGAVSRAFLHLRHRASALRKVRGREYRQGPVGGQGLRPELCARVSGVGVGADEQTVCLSAYSLKLLPQVWLPCLSEWAGRTHLL